MSYPQRTRKFLETRALSPGEVKVRIFKGETLLYTKIGYKYANTARVEYEGRFVEAERFGQHWRLDIAKLNEEGQHVG